MKSSTRLLGTAALAVTLSIGVGAPAAFAHGDQHGYGNGHHGFAAHSNGYGHHGWGRSGHHPGWSDDHEGRDHDARADGGWDHGDWDHGDWDHDGWSRDGKWDRDRHTWKRDDKYDPDRYQWKRDDKYDPDRYQWKRDDGDDAKRATEPDRAPAVRSVAVKHRAHQRVEQRADRRADFDKRADFTQRQQALLATLQRTSSFLDTLHSRIADSDMDPTVQSAVLGAIEAYQTRITELTDQAQAATTPDELRAVVDQLKALFPTALAPMASGARYAAMMR